MPRHAPTSLLLAALAAALTAGAACSVHTGPSPTSCADDADCPADAHCLDATCTADQPPVAAISGPRVATAGATITFDGAASGDADDDIVSWTWSVRVLAASCTPDLGAATDASFRPTFGCPGEFQVILVVRDRTGILSEPAIADVTVTAG